MSKIDWKPTVEDLRNNTLGSESPVEEVDFWKELARTWMDTNAKLIAENERLKESPKVAWTAKDRDGVRTLLEHCTDRTYDPKRIERMLRDAIKAERIRWVAEVGRLREAEVNTWKMIASRVAALTRDSAELTKRVAELEESGKVTFRRMDDYRRTLRDVVVGLGLPESVILKLDEVVGQVQALNLKSKVR